MGGRDDWGQRKKPCDVFVSVELGEKPSERKPLSGRKPSGQVQLLVSEGKVSVQKPHRGVEQFLPCFDLNLEYDRGSN